MTDNNALAQELEALQDWLREPDHAETFGTDEILLWINRRPTHIIPKVIAALRTPSQRCENNFRRPLDATSNRL